MGQLDILILYFMSFQISDKRMDVIPTCTNDEVSLIRLLLAKGGVITKDVEKRQ
jgi:hypothetical protein